MHIITTLFVLTISPAMAAEAPAAKNALGASVSSQLQMPNKGTVVSTIVTSNYTYIEVLENGKPLWLAALNVAPVNKGDMVSYSTGPVMANFYSKNLKRSFDKIIFVSKVAVVK